MDNEIKICPKCKKEMIVNPYYPEWCEKCDWNISPNFSKVETSSFDKIYYFLGSKIASGLFERVSNKGKKISKIRFSRILAYVIAGAVQLTCILFIYLAILSWQVHFLQTVILLVIAYFSLPKFKKIKEVPLAENKYPTLYKIVNEIASKLDSEKIDALYMDFEYNAFFKKGFMGEGLKMKTVICIGLPLFYILEPQEKVAVIAHEVAHNVNKDFTRSFFIQTARDTLFKWYTFFSPNTEFGGYASLIRMVFVVPRYLILAVWYILAFLLYRDSQISEYHADRLAAEVSGSDAYISALRKLLFSYQFYFMRDRMGLSNLDSFFERFIYRINNMPDKELERVKRLENAKNVRMDATHPPKCYRISYIRGLNFSNPLYHIEPDDIEKLNKELGFR